MASEFFKSLISKGYFPQEMPPWFQTDNLASILDDIILNLPSLTKKTSKCCRYSLPKGKMTRRLLSVPNPLHHIKLCKVLDDEWSYLRELISSSQISLTIPSVRARSLRALSRKFSFKEISEKMITSSSGSRYLLRTDISRYYNTIYTHSIPWAIHTKDVAKANKRNMNYVGNRIDNAIQSSQDGQTNGIPIGPDTSLLISELLCSSMDKKVENIKYKSAFRYMDDYFMFFDSLSDAEKAYSELHKIIREYELELNPYKTKIIKLPERLEPQWVSLLDSSPTKATELLSFISKIFEYSKMFPEDEVIKYGLSKIKNVNIGQKQKDILVSFLLNAIMHEPSAIPLAIEMLVALNNNHNIVTQIKDTIQELLVFNAEYRYEFELTWLLWLCDVLNIAIDENVAKSLSIIDNSFVALAALHLKNKGLIDQGLDTTLWASMMKGEELYEENWLLAYEAYIKGWLPSVSDTDYLLEDPFFEILKNKDIQFFITDAYNQWNSKPVIKKWLYSEFSSVF